MKALLRKIIAVKATADAKAEESEVYTKAEVEALISAAIEAIPEPSPGGATDHGALTGLTDDDHSQYHNNTRGDARYSLTSHNHSGVYEPSFSKNTGFNKNLGTTAGTVSEGNHTHATYLPLAGGVMTGSLGLKVATINGEDPYNVANDDCVLYVSSADFAQIITLDSANAQHFIIIICTDITNGITVTGLMAGDYTFTSQYESIIVITNSAESYIASKYSP